MTVDNDAKPGDGPTPAALSSESARARDTDRGPAADQTDPAPIDAGDSALDSPSVADDHRATDSDEDEAFDDSVADRDDDDSAAWESEPAIVEISRTLFLAGIAVVTLAILTLAASTIYFFREKNDAENPVIATVNGAKIHRDQYDKMVAAQGGDRLVEQLVNERLIDGEASKRGVTVDDADVTRLLEAERLRFGGAERFNAALAQAGLTEDELRVRLRRTELMRKLVADQTQVTDQEISARYEETKDQFGGQTLDQAREEIREAIRQEKADEAVPAMLQKLKESATIESKVPGQTALPLRTP